MADASPGVIEATTVLAAKLGSGLLGSLLSLRWMPTETTKLDRFIAVLGGFAAAALVGPAIAEVSGVHSARIENAIVFAVGLFGMTVVSELMVVVKEVGLPAIVRDLARKVFGLREG